MNYQNCLIAGVDEAGRGALAGDLFAAAVILPNVDYPADLIDSKKLTISKRDEMYRWIYQNALSVGVGIVFVNEIDDLNIHNASLLAMQRAIAQLNHPYQSLLIDGKFVPAKYPFAKAIIKGDQKIPAISAASIVAKVTRDKAMISLAKQFPNYDFEKNKGYPTKKHLLALNQFGACFCHRQSYAPIKNLNIEKIK